MALAAGESTNPFAPDVPGGRALWELTSGSSHGSQGALREFAGSRQDQINKMRAENLQIEEMIRRLQEENAYLQAANERLKIDNALMEPEALDRISWAHMGPPPGQRTESRRYGETLGHCVHTAAGPRPSKSDVGAMDEEDPRMQYRLTKIMRTHEAPVHSVNFFRNEPGRLVSAVGGASSAGVVATAAWDAYIHVYDLDQHDRAALVRTLGDHEEEDDENTIRMGGLYDVKFSGTCPNILAAASADTFVYVWNYNRNQMITRLKGHKDEVNGIAFHPVQQVLCSTSDDCTANIWDIHEGIHVRTLRNHVKAAYGATFMGADNPYEVATCSYDHKVRVYDMRDPKVIATLQEHEDDVVGLDFTEKRHWMASGSDDGCICVWDNRVWDKPLFKIDTRSKTEGLSGNEVKRVKFNPSGTKLAAACSALQARVYLLESAPSLYGILDGNNPHEDTIFDVCFGVDARGKEFVVDASHDETCYVWREEGGYVGRRPRRRSRSGSESGSEMEGHGKAGPISISI